MDSILTSVKKMLGISEDYTAFDPDIVMHINSVFTVLNQLGVGPENPFSIEDSGSTWGDFLDEPNKLSLVKSYIYLKVRLLFDPPQSSAAIDSINKQIAEFEWRLNVAVDPGEEENE